MLKLHESTAAVGTESLGEGKYRIRIIVPGQGSSGIYTAENLAESAPLFKAGTEMFIDHPTESEEWERPERSIRDYAGWSINISVPALNKGAVSAKFSAV